MNINPLAAYNHAESDEEEDYASSNPSCDIVLPLPVLPLVEPNQLNIATNDQQPDSDSDSEVETCEETDDTEYNIAPYQANQVQHRMSPQNSPSSNSWNKNPEVAMLNRKVASLSSLLEKVRSKSRQQSEQLEEAEAKQNSTDKELKTAQDNLRQKERSISDLQFELSRAQKNSIETGTNSESFVERLKAFQAKVSVTALNRETLLSQLRKKNNQIVQTDDPQDLKRTILFLQEELSQSQILVSEQEIKMAELQHQLTTSQARLMASTEENSSYKDQLAALQQTITDLESRSNEQTEEASEEKEKFKVERDSWHREEVKLNAMVEDLNSQLAEHEPEVVDDDEAVPMETLDADVDLPVIINARGSMVMPSGGHLLGAAVASASITTAHASKIADSQNARAREALSNPSELTQDELEQVTLITKGVLSKLGLDANNIPYSKKHFFALYATNCNYQDFYPTVNRAAELRWGRSESSFRAYSHGTTVNNAYYDTDAITFLQTQGASGAQLAAMVRPDDVCRLIVMSTVDGRYVMLMTKDSDVYNNARTWSAHVAAAVEMNYNLIKKLLPEAPPPPPRITIVQAPPSIPEEKEEVVVVTMPIPTKASVSASTTPAFTSPLRSRLIKFTHNGKDAHEKEFCLNPSGTIKWGDNALKYKYEEVVKSVLRGHDSNLKIDHKTLKEINFDMIFTIVTTGKQLYLVAPDERVLNEWMDALELVIQNNMK